VIGSNIFVHAGLVDGLIEEMHLTQVDDMEKINIKIRKWLLGLLDVDQVKHMVDCTGSRPDSMFWTRILGNIPPDTPMDDPVCVNNVGKILRLFNIGSMVIGHTPQSFKYSDDINSTCSNRVWRVDNGSSSAFDQYDSIYTHSSGTKKNKSRRVQYLEISEDTNYYVCDETKCRGKDGKTYSHTIRNITIDLDTRVD
jgi:hypothetical protein